MFRYNFLILFIVFSCNRPSDIEVVDTRLIWSESKHNAFTTLISYNGYLYCAFREAISHHSYDGEIRIIRSKDAKKWESISLISIPQEDLRDPKFILNDNQLNLFFLSRTKTKHFSYSYISNNGEEWSQINKEQDTWRWGATRFKGEVYSVGYSGKDKEGEIYKTQKGESWVSVKDRLFPDVHSYPNETALFFSSNKRLYALLRQDKKEKMALIGISEPPYEVWNWKNLGIRIGSPSGLLVKENLILACVRLYNPVRTSLVWINPLNGDFYEEVVLPSGGDTGYADIVKHKGVYYVSYNSSKNLTGQTSIYLSEFTINAEK